MTALAVTIVAAVLLGPGCADDADDASPAATDGRPNLVFAFTDDQANDSVHPEAMPWLTSHPGGHWWTTTLTYNLSVCCPSRATFLTGRTASHTGVVDNASGARLDEQSTVAVALQDAGYHTCKVGKYLNDWPFDGDLSAPPGWNRWAVFDRAAGYYDYALSVDGERVAYGDDPSDYSTDVLLEHALDCIRGRPEGRPFYLDLSFFAPHGVPTPAPAHADNEVEPPDEGPNFNEADMSDKAAALRARPPLTSAEVRQWRERRDDAFLTLRSVDDALRRLFDVLADEDIVDDTVFLFTSDNANAFGEHRLTSKRCWFDECLRFPLLIRWPDGPAPTRAEDRLVGNVDIGPTLAELGGAELPVRPDGRSLVPLLEGESVDRRTSLLLEDTSPRGGDNFLGTYWGLRTDRYTYVELTTGEIELYDHVRDPHELTNLGRDPTTAGLRAELHAELERLRAGP